MDIWQVKSCINENSVLAGSAPMRRKGAFVADSPDSGMKHPHEVGLASHRCNGNFGEGCPVGPQGKEDLPDETRGTGLLHEL
jgi:hypothetical protein